MSVRSKFVTSAAILSLACLALAPVAVAQDGGATYKARCAVCHGVDGKGHTPMGKTFKIEDLTSPAVKKMSDADLEAIVSKGKGHMPAYGSSLGPAGVKAVVTFIKSMK